MHDSGAEIMEIFNSSNYFFHLSDISIDGDRTIRGSYYQSELFLVAQTCILEIIDNVPSGIEWQHQGWHVSTIRSNTEESDHVRMFKPHPFLGMFDEILIKNYCHKLKFVCQN